MTPLLPALVFAAASQEAIDPTHAIVSVERLWDRAPYNAFTDLVEHRGRLYCAFREGQRHVHGFDGTVRVIASDDGQNWRSLALLDEAGVDLRDPKLSVTPDGRVMVVMGGSVYRDRELVRRDPLVAFSDAAGERFGPPQRAVIDPAVRTDVDWLWRVTWHEGVGYGVVYQPLPERWGLQLVTSTDGLRWELCATLELDGRPSETALGFEPDGTLVALARRDGADRTGRLGRSSPPYVDWRWSTVPTRLGGPGLVRLADGTWVAATRHHLEDGTTRTALHVLGPDGAILRTLDLPSGGDTSYPGLVLRGERLFVSYYSGHEGRAAIYLATVRVVALQPR